MSKLQPIASDLDGTYTDHPELWGKIDFIISANNWDKYKEIMDEEDIHLPIFFNPGEEDLPEIIKHKSNVLNKTGAVKYYEDQKIQADMLRLLCPKCKIVLVKEGETAL
jgi:hypothetical protein